MKSNRSHVVSRDHRPPWSKVPHPFRGGTWWDLKGLGRRTFGGLTARDARARQLRRDRSRPIRVGRGIAGGIGASWSVLVRWPDLRFPLLGAGDQWSPVAPIGQRSGRCG